MDESLAILRGVTLGNWCFKWSFLFTPSSESSSWILRGRVMVGFPTGDGIGQQAQDKICLEDAWWYLMAATFFWMIFDASLLKILLAWWGRWVDPLKYSQVLFASNLNPQAADMPKCPSQRHIGRKLYSQRWGLESELWRGFVGRPKLPFQHIFSRFYVA